MKYKIYIVSDGTNAYGSQIIKYFEKLGAKNSRELRGNGVKRKYYFIENEIIVNEIYKPSELRRISLDRKLKLERILKWNLEQGE